MSDRVWLTLATFAFAALLYLLMLKGWRGRERRQGDLPPPPAAPADTGTVLVGSTRGLFVGTTAAEHWLDRIAVHGLGHRASGWLTVTDTGVRVEREGQDDLWLPYDVLLEASTGDALAGKMVGRDGLVLLRWRLGARELLSGFRADDHALHPRLAEVAQSQVTARSA